MNPEKLWNIDLNLLVMLSVLLEEQSVTRTAERLHLTPSAVSHALKRLRDLFQDELLVRDGRRMLATVRAQQLAEILPRALGQLANTLAAPEVFAPASSTRTFRLAAPDFIAPHVLREVGASAPHVRVEFLPSSPTAVVDLTQNHYDALVAPRSFKNEGLRAESLGEWQWVVYGRQGHPVFKDWSLESWASYPHLQIGTSGMRGQGPVDKCLMHLGVKRHIGGIIPYFSMAAAIIAQTDLLVTLPSIIMRRDVEFYEFESRSAPFDIPPMRLSLFRSATRGDESGIKWFLNQITTACRSL